jgi:hypothetical protein
MKNPITTVKAHTPFDEPITAQVLEQAIERGKLRSRSGIHAQEVSYLSAQKALLIGFADHSALLLPVQNYPEFAALSAAQLRQITVGFGGSALCLDERDLHVSITGLVKASQPLMSMAATVIASRNGQRSSNAKAQASRANGSKGGRPKRVGKAVISL